MCLLLSVRAYEREAAGASGRLRNGTAETPRSRRATTGTASHPGARSQVGSRTICERACVNGDMTQFRHGVQTVGVPAGGGRCST